VDYYEAVFPRLSDRGLIAADNTLSGGRVLDGADAEGSGAAIVRFNEHVRNDPRAVSVLLTIRDGVTLIRPKDAG
jgi:caffeoyl-CoA O-methyltransferase